MVHPLWSIWCFDSTQKMIVLLKRLITAVVLHYWCCCTCVCSLHQSIRTPIQSDTYASPGDMLTCISGCWRRGFTGDKFGLQYGYICSVISKHTHKPWCYLFKGNLSVYSVGIAYPRLAFIDKGTGIGKMVGGYKYDFSCKHGGNNDIFRSRCAVRSETDRKQGIFENHSLYIRYQSMNANRVPQVRQSRFVWYTSEIQLGWRIRPCQ